MLENSNGKVSMHKHIPDGTLLWSTWDWGILSPTQSL